MRRWLFAVIACGVVAVSAGCSSVPPYRYSEDMSGVELGKDEGIAVFRVHNYAAGKTGHFSYADTGRPTTAAPFVLNSDLKIQRNGGIPFIVANRKAPEQVVCIPLKKGAYAILEAGEHSTFGKLYSFKVEPGRVNYAGDFYLRLYMAEPRSERSSVVDWYSLEVRDQMDETMSLLYERYPNMTVHGEPVDKATPCAETKPLFCAGRLVEASEFE